MLSEILFVTLVTIFLKNATAITDEQKAVIQEKFVSFGTQCIVDHPLSIDDINSFKQKLFPEGENATCFAACLFRKLGLIDDKGNYSYNDLLEETKKEFEEEDQKIFKELLGTCDKVNEEDVTDSENGCDRSKLAYNCLIEQAPTYGFDIDI